MNREFTFLKKAIQRTKALKNRVFILWLALLAAPGWGATFSGGSGTPAAPYLISTPADLTALRDAVNAGTNYENTWFKLTADINLGGTAWTPIGERGNPFRGHFDGDGHKITGLNATGIASSNDAVLLVAGLFGCVWGGTISNLSVSGSVVGTSDSRHVYAGGIVGSLQGGGTVTNCSFTGMVTATATSSGGERSAYAGGIAGGIANDNPTSGCSVVTGCSVSNATINAVATVSGQFDGAYAGGIAGFLSGSSSNPAQMTDCVAGADVTVSAMQGSVPGSGSAGGVLGEVKNRPTISGNVYYGNSANGIGNVPNYGGADPGWVEPDPNSLVLDFGSVIDGYAAAPGEKTVTIKNNTAGNVTLTQPQQAQGWTFGMLSTYSLTTSGDEATLTVRPDAGLAAGNYDATLQVQYTLPSSVVKQTRPVSLKFTVLPRPNYTVTFDAQGHGLTPSAQTVTAGSKVTEPAMPSVEGWTFVGWYRESACTNEWDFANNTVSEDTRLYALWKANYFDLALSIKGKGNASLSGVSAVVGGEVSVAATPALGYMLSSITYTPAGGKPVDVTSTGAFTMPAADVSVSVTFMQIPPTQTRHDVTLAENEGAITDPAPGTYHVISGNNFKFRVMPQSGYAFHSRPTVTTGMANYDGRIEYTPVVVGGRVVAYDIRLTDIRRPFSISFVGGISPVGNEEVGGTRVWANAGTLYIQISGETAHVQVFNLAGTLVADKHAPTGQSIITGLPCGIYLVRIDEKTFKAVVD